MPNKFWEKYIKNQHFVSFRNHQVGARGDPPGPQAPWWRVPTLGRAEGASGLPGGPWLPPFAYIYPSGQNRFSRSLLCSAAAAVSRSGLTADPVPAPCRREDLPPGDSPSPWTLLGLLVSSPPLTMGP